ncbi:MAG: Mfa1 family fimbria major subunit [Bacteroidales bacterium]|nr:Mfa1 family fimbria major subunit [Bacteroidales bacterium]
MRISSFHIRFLVALILISVVFLSCKKEGPYFDTGLSDQESPELVSAWLSLDLNVVSSGAATKADNVVGGVNKGIDEEKITRLAIWLVPVEDETEKWSEAIMTYVPDLTLYSEESYVASVKTKLDVPMNVYVGANISTDIASEFLAGGPDAVYKAATAAYPDDYSSLVNQFASADVGVAMFCVKKASLTFNAANANESDPAVIDEDSNGTPESVDLVRMLAKVHLLFQCYETHPEFVKITEPGSLTPAAFGAFGWSKLDDISYIVNTVNRSTRVIQPEYGGAYASYMDMNHSMTDLLQKGLEWEYNGTAGGQFLGFAENLSGNHDAAWAKWSAKPEKYEENKAPFGTCTDGTYVNGLYCLENTTDDSALSSMTDDEKKYVPFMVATHIIVKARFVPREINTVEDGILKTIDYGDMNDDDVLDDDAYGKALAALPAVDGVDENGNSHTYPAGTFFTRDMKEFYDYKGMLKLIETVSGLSRKNFATYPGGYGFYYSYIHGGEDSDTHQVTFKGADSGVFRNHYHILNCQLMKVPATPGSFNQLMMVNSKVVNWNLKGALNLIVKPNV